MIHIVDYGMGNLFSIYNALNRVGGSPTIVSTPEELKGCEGIVIPGVGAFGRCMERLARFEGPLTQALEDGTPILGICVGMQVLFDASEESPGARGLGWIAGQVIRLPEGVMIPQMGWNTLTKLKEIPILDGVASNNQFYFVHSYHCVPNDPDVIVGTTDHGVDVVAVVAKDNLYATQFHPEKSGSIGLRILENFVRMVRC